ncbi:CPCC family cysteine-rich protein [Zooshikella harenae]|uniref:Cysteine-rich CPCC domain-containing protein n=1 Tax=Zooshikella harenae TaxID=2827238 RepID=A0ABS5ZK96_9GAMM|nr:CPCC family cysteine-rich protein [Zooshikella harenae]MBU2714243.1 hypothetical protein [Zooshikella harenae]
MKVISREEVVKLVTKCRLAFNSRDELLELLEDIDESVELENQVFEVLAELYIGVSNGYLSELYEGMTGKKVEVIGDVAEMFRCPCCNMKTLSEVYNQEEGTGYDICDYCNWEDDGTADIDSSSGANKGSIKEYRDRIKEQPNLFYRNKWLSN